MKEIYQIIENTLEKIGMHSEDAVNLVYRTGKAESGYRKLKQMQGGCALSYWQIEPATIEDTIKNYLDYRPETYDKLVDLGFDCLDPDWSVLTNIPVAIAFCRLKYYRDPNPIPKTIKGQAKYWKTIYNSEQGKGSVKHFLEANK